MKWISFQQVKPQKWAFKKDIPEPWQFWAVQVEFLFEKAWIVRDHNKLVLMPDGEWTRTHDFFLRTPGHVIGLCDLQTADAHDWANEWKSSMIDRINERLKLCSSQ